MTGRRTVELPLDMIDVPERLRPIDDPHVEQLAESIERRGLDAVISIGDKSLLFPRFDNVCSQIATWLRENHHG